MVPRVIFSLSKVLCIVAFFPSGAAVHGATFPIAAESLVKVGIHTPGGSSWLSGSVIHSTGGVVIVVTNSHGLRDGIRDASIVIPGIGEVTARLLAAGDPDDKRADLAIFAAQVGRDLPPIRIASEPPQIGDRVYSAGFPRNSPAPTAKSGTVLAFATNGNLRCSFATQEGDSGSPTVNEAGELVGVVWGSGGQDSSSVHARHLLRLVENQCSGPTCTQIFGGSPMQILQPRARQQIASPDLRPMPQPALGNPVSPMPNPASPMPNPVSPMLNSASSIDYTRLADEIVKDEVFFARLGTDPRFVGPPGPPGTPGRDGRDGIDANAPSIDYSKIGDWIQETIPAAISAHDEAKPVDWLGSLVTVAAALGLDVAIPGGALGLVGLKLLGSFFRYRQATRRSPAAEVGPVPFERPAAKAAITDHHAPRTAQPEIVHVPTINLEAEALHEALTREIKAFPTHAPVIKRIRSVAEQLLAGRRVTDGGRGGENNKGNRVGWSDE